MTAPLGPITARAALQQDVLPVVLDASAPHRLRNPAPTRADYSPLAQEAVLQFHGDWPGGCGQEYVELVWCPLRPAWAQEGTVP